jgi:two-component system response regulator AdeR
VSSPIALIIEDDETIGEIFTIALKEAQYDPIYLRNGREALERLSLLQPNLVVLDLHLPRLPGAMILRAIRSDTRLSRTQIIVVSADEALAEDLRGDADAVLIKPVGFYQVRDLAHQMKMARSDIE